MLLTRYVPTLLDDDVISKGMGVMRYKDGMLQPMVHPPEEAMMENEEGHHHPAFHHDGDGNLLSQETGAHPIDGVIRMLDQRLEEYRMALSERAAQGDSRAEQLLQDLQNINGPVLVDRAIQLHNRNHPNQQLPPKESPEYRKNSIDIYPDRNTKGNVFLNDGTTLVNYWSNKGVPKNKAPGYGYESGAIHFGPELHEILNQSAFMQAVRYLAETGVPISGVNKDTPSYALTSQKHLQQDMGKNYIGPHMLSFEEGHKLHRFPTRKGGLPDMGEMANKFGFDDQMHHSEGLHPSQILHHLPYEFFSHEGGRTIDTTREIANMLQDPKIREFFGTIPIGNHTLADYNSPEDIQIISDAIAKKAATKVLFGHRDDMQPKSHTHGLLNRTINGLSDEQKLEYNKHMQSMGNHGPSRNFSTKVAALANVHGPHPEAPNRAHFHGDMENHVGENNVRHVVEALAQGHMMAKNLELHAPRPDLSTSMRPPDYPEGIPLSQLTGIHNENLAQQGIYGHTFKQPPKESPPFKFPKEPTPEEVAAALTQVKRPSPSQTRLDEFDPQMLTASTGWDSARALARSESLRKFWKCVR